MKDLASFFVTVGSVCATGCIVWVTILFFWLMSQRIKNYPKPALVKTLLKWGNRALVYLALSFIVFVAGLAIALGLSPEKASTDVILMLIAIPLFGWLPFKMLLWMASGGGNKVIDRLLQPKSPS